MRSRKEGRKEGSGKRRRKDSEWKGGKKEVKK
jgi:hypothetical protein